MRFFCVKIRLDILSISTELPEGSISYPSQIKYREQSAFLIIMQIHDQLQAILNSLTILREKRWLLILCTAIFLSSIGLGLTIPVVSIYALSFGVTATLVGLLFTAFALGRVLVTIPAGRLADRWGRRILMIGGMLLVSVSAFGQGIANEYFQLLIFRLFQGMGSAMFMSVSFLVVADLTMPEERGRVTSIFQGSIMIGLAVSPALGGIIANNIGLKAPFFLYSSLAFLTALFVWRFLPETLGESTHTNGGLNEKVDESKSSSTTRELLTDRNFILISLAAFLIFVGRAGARDTILPLLGVENLGLTAASLGLIYTLIQMTNLLAIPFAGLITDRMGRKPAVILGLSVQGIGMGLVGTAWLYPWFLSGAVFMGAGKGLGETSSVVYVTDLSPIGKYGTTYGLFLTLRDFGLLIGPVVLGLIADVAGLRFSIILNGVAMICLALIFWVFAKETLTTKVSGYVETN